MPNTTTLTPGTTLVPNWRPTHIYDITADDTLRVAVARGALILAAKQGITLTYTDLSHITGVNKQGAAMTRLLDLLSEDCHNRGEPSLAALTVRKDTGEPGDGFVLSGGGTKWDAQQDAFTYWSTP